jgi:hypothetical protein
MAMELFRYLRPAKERGIPEYVFERKAANVPAILKEDAQGAHEVLGMKLQPSLFIRLSGYKRRTDPWIMAFNFLTYWLAIAEISKAVSQQNLHPDLGLRWSTISCRHEQQRSLCK